MGFVSTKRQFEVALCIILVAFAGLSVSYSFATRLKWGPDEPAHFIYIRSLATEFAPPPIAHHETRTEDSRSTHEGHQPPLYYALMALPYAFLKAAGASNEIVWRTLRLLGVVIGVAWIYLVYVLARECFKKDSYALATAAFASLIPTSGYMAGVINNEILIALLFTWSMIPILAYFKSGEMPMKRAISLGLLIGLAILVKAQGLVLIPTFLLACLAVCRRQRYADYKEALRGVGVVLGIAAVVCGWWFVRAWVLYGTVMPRSLYNPMLEEGMMLFFVDPAWTITNLWRITALLYGYFMVPFWLVQKHVAWWDYFGALCAFTAVAVIGLVTRLRRDRDIDRRALAFLLFAPAATYVLYIRYVLVVDHMAKLQGRLFLSVAAVAAIFFIVGFDGLLRSARAKKVGAICGCALMLLANVAVIASAVALYY